MLTKGAIGNLINRYKAVLKKCNLINTFGSLAVASMLVLGGAGVASAVDFNISTQQDFGTLNPEVTGNTTLTLGGGEYNASWWIRSANGTNTVTGYNKIVYSGTNYASGQDSFFLAYGTGILDINNINTITTQDNNNSHSVFFNNFGGGHTKISDVKNIDIRNVLVAFQINYNTNDAKIEVNNVDNIYVEAGRTVGIYATQSGSASIDLQAKNIELHSTGDNGIQAYGGTIGLTADENITINTNNGTVVSWGYGDTTTKIDINAKYIDITSNDMALYATDDAELNVGKNADFVKADITGDIEAESIGRVDVNLGTNGSLTGAISTDDTSTTSLGVGTDSNWNATGDSNVTTLAIDDGNVNIASGVDIVTGSVSGTGNINMVDATGSFTAEAAAADVALNVQAIKEDGTVKTADEVDTATLKTMMANVDAGEAQISASAAEGIVNAGFTTDSKGNIVSGGGASSVTKVVLESASINTVSLDKILTNDVRKRLGDIRSDKNQTGVWMRWDGGKLKGDSGLTNDFNTIQIGGDTKVGKNCRLGVAGSFTHGDGEFDRGHSELEGFSFAAYATWMGENGMFADVVARLGHFSTEMNVEGRTGDMDNRVFSLSGEYGWRFNVCEQFFIEPQVELAYTYVNSEDLQLGDARFAFDSVDSLTGRAGLVFGWNLPDDRGNVYARASVLQQFMGDAKVTGYSAIGPTVHETDGEDTWLEYGIGANIKLTDKTYIWADVERTEGADVEEEWRGTVGIRYSF